MKKGLLIFVICSFVAAPALADLGFGNGEGFDAGTAHIDRYTKYYADNGGEFTLSDNTPGSFVLNNNGYADVTKGVGGNPESFQTFCVETGEYTANPLEVWFSNASAETPSVAGSGSHAWTGKYNMLPDGGDSLDPRTAYLYTQFAKGTLSNYRYTELSNGNRASDAGQLQRAIWSIEDVLTLKTDGTDAKAKAWVAEAAAAVADESIWGDTIGYVRVLQTYWYDAAESKMYEVKQDQLYLIPVPGAVLLGVLGLGTAGLRLRKRS